MAIVKKLQRHRILAATLIACSALFLMVPSLTHADGPAWYSCVSSPVTCAIYWVSYLVNTILGFLVGIAAWIMGVAFTLTLGAIDLPAVKIGFAFTLSFANLGFVLGIIVIAIATILRNQTYGIKKILGKLIVMAILINFSLTIAGTIINISDNLSRVFLNQMAPGAVEGSISTFAGVQGFVTAMTGAFVPQSLYAPPVTVDLARDLSGFVRSIFSLIFGMIFMGLMLIVYLAIDAILIIRTVYIALLVVLMPLAWISWVFPISQKNWTEWWDKFLKWVYFPPIVLFFLYLAVLTVQVKSFSNCLRSAESLTGITGEFFDIDLAPPNCGDLRTAVGGVENVISGTVGRLVGGSGVKDDNGMMAGAVQMLVVAGLAIGGLFAAQKVGAVGAGVAMGAATAAGQGFANWGVQRARRFPGGAARYLSTPKAPTRNRWYHNPLQGILAPKAAQEAAANAARRPADIAAAAAAGANARREVQAAREDAEAKRQRAASAREAAQGVMLAGHAPDSPEVQRAVLSANTAEQEARDAEENLVAKEKKAQDLGEKEAKLRGGEDEGDKKSEQSAPSSDKKEAVAPHPTPTGAGGDGGSEVSHEASKHPTTAAIPVSPPEKSDKKKEKDQEDEKKKEEKSAPAIPPTPIFARSIGEEVARPIKKIAKTIAENFKESRAEKGILKSVGGMITPDGLRRWVSNYGVRALGSQLKEDQEAKKKGAATGLLGSTIGAAAGAAWKGILKETGLKGAPHVKLTDEQMEALGHLLHHHPEGSGHKEDHGGGEDHPKEGGGDEGGADHTPKH